MKPTLSTTAIGCALLMAGCDPRPGKVIDQWETTNNTFKVRVVVYSEGNRAHIFEPGTHYSFLSAAAGANNWSLITRAYYSHGKQLPNLNDHVRFVNDKVGYLFLRSWYMVTVDGGSTWHSWSIPAHLPDETYDSDSLIEDVTISPDGKGEIRLNPEGTVDRQTLKLMTEDYGQRWSLKLNN